MKVPLLALLTAVVVALPGPVAPALARSTNVECTCWDVSVIGADVRGPRLLLKNQGVRGWNIYDLAPNRTSILFSHGPLYRASVTGKHVRELAKDRSYSARWSPDGSLVAFSTTSAGCAGGVSAALVVIAADGARRRTVGECAYDGAWSPDSRRLAFVRRIPDASVLSIVNADGTGRRDLVAGSIDEVRWSPNGRWIAYTIGYPPRIHVIRVDGSEDDAVGSGNGIRWAPTSRRLTFRAVVGRNRGALFAANRDGKRSVRLAAAAGPGVWSPSGRRIAYGGCHLVGKTCLSAIYVVAATGHRRHELVHGGPTTELGPLYWSRDGKRIFYTHDVQSGE